MTEVKAVRCPKTEPPNRSDVGFEEQQTRYRQTDVPDILKMASTYVIIQFIPIGNGIPDNLAGIPIAASFFRPASFSRLEQRRR
ncbi:MAG: hypothetical protein J6128_07015 [Clostridia bacterium]|nr:hypothetical protein [Clostridia bacterium]